MNNKTSDDSFVGSCFFLSFFCVFSVVISLVIYFLLPVEKKETVVLPEVVGNTEDVFEGNFELELSEAFQEYLADVSFFELEDETDTGLTYYRQSTSRAAVEWFYTHIAGSKEVAQAILTEADKNDIPLSLAFALAYTESRYNTNAVHKNANSTIDRGLFQLNSNTFPKLTESDFFDPYVSSKYGMSHLKFCLNTAGNEVAGLAMYNAGTNRVRSNTTPQTTLNYVGNIVTYQKMLENLFAQEVITYFENDFVQGVTVAYATSDKH